MIRAIVFDLDGTLVDTLADIAEAVNSTLVRYDRVPHPIREYASMVGWGLRRTVETASAGSFDPDQFEEVLSNVMEAYRARPVVHSRAYEGVLGLLPAVAGRLSLGVLSNKEDGMTKTIVSALFPPLFQSVRGALPTRPLKPDPSTLLEMLAAWGIPPDQCAFLGDSGVDMETARRAGVFACGALWGYRDKDELREAGAQEFFASPRAFHAWLNLDKTKLRIETEEGESP